MEIPVIITNTISKYSYVPSTVVSFCKHIWEEHKIVVVGVVTSAVVVAVKLRRAAARERLREEWDSAGKDVVVVHAIPSATTCPNLSPFVLKIETFMRMAGIKYQCKPDQIYGPKGKFPWITLNGEDYADSQLIMEFLGKKFNKDFNSHLTEEQKAIARAMLIMNDEHILWGLIWWRYVKDPDQRVNDLMKSSFVLRMVFKYLGYYKFPKMLWAQGIGRHTEYEIVGIIRKDIEALSLYLGKKKFMMGDTPCEVDCAIFGMLSQFVWGAPGSPFALMLQIQYQNLQNYCFRMKEKFWPDWEEHLLVSTLKCPTIAC